MIRRSKQAIGLFVFLISVVVIVLLVWQPFGEKVVKNITDHSSRSLSIKLIDRDTPVLAFQFSIQHTTPQEAKHISDAHQKSHEKIQNIINNPLLNGAIIGLSLRDAETGDLLYDHFGDTRLRPASNMKMLTAATALEVLGPDYVFSTHLLTDGKITKNKLQGNLYIQGQGDPTLLKKDFDHFARELKEKGIQKITGHLIGDDQWYDDIRYSQDLNWTDEFNYTGAQVSALTLSPNENYHTGTVVVRVYPSEKTGEKPTVTITPETDYVTITNNGQTVSHNSKNTLTVEREHGTNEFIIKGEIPKNTVTEVWRAVWEPTEYVLHIFKQSLEEQGIKLAKNSEILTKKTPKNAERLVSKHSMPLKDILVPFMKLSNNGHGEMLVKEMGKVMNDEGSWKEGLQVMEESLKNLGIDTSNLRLRDGSGMSHNNLITPNDLSHLLYEIQAQDWFEHFENSQPVAGEADRMIGGTLSDRMIGELTKGNVKAKTGSLNGVSTLSGYLVNQAGEKQIFSIMINNYIDGYMPNIQDAIVEELVKIR